MEHHLCLLENGLRVLLRPQISPITHVCIIINVGSRDEAIGKYGVAHFIEHLLFKRTEKRNTKQIIDRLEAIGGDLNAYTTKENICLHASFLKPYLQRALELFNDILFCSLFPEEELEKEKGVILDEMASYLDSPEESIMDDFEDLLYKNTTLGHNILGTEGDLKGMRRNDVQDFVGNHFSADKIAIGISGDYAKTKVEKWANKIFAHVPFTTPKEDLVMESFSAFETRLILGKPINQAHYIVGSQAYGIYDERKTTTLLLNNLLGGFGMSSILNLKIREKYGIAYTIESNYSLYRDTGAFSIYLGTDEEKLEKAVFLVKKELKQLINKPMGYHFLEKAKIKFKGQISLAEENRLNVIIAETKNILDYNRIVTLNDVFKKIDRVTSEHIQEVANDLFVDKHMVSLTFNPEE